MGLVRQIVDNVTNIKVQGFTAQEKQVTIDLAKKYYDRSIRLHVVVLILNLLAFEGIRSDVIRVELEYVVIAIIVFEFALERFFQERMYSQRRKQLTLTNFDLIPLRSFSFHVSMLSNWAMKLTYAGIYVAAGLHIAAFLMFIRFVLPLSEFLNNRIKLRRIKTFSGVAVKGEEQGQYTLFKVEDTKEILFLPKTNQQEVTTVSSGLLAELEKEDELHADSMLELLQETRRINRGTKINLFITAYIYFVLPFLMYMVSWVLFNDIVERSPEFVLIVIVLANLGLVVGMWLKNEKLPIHSRKETQKRIETYFKENSIEENDQENIKEIHNRILGFDKSKPRGLLSRMIIGSRTLHRQYEW
jgi:hypothetical protein